MASFSTHTSFVTREAGLKLSLKQQALGKLLSLIMGNISFTWDNRITICHCFNTLEKWFPTHLLPNSIVAYLYSSASQLFSSIPHTCHAAYSGKDCCEARMAAIWMGEFGFPHPHGNHFLWLYLLAAMFTHYDGGRVKKSISCYYIIYCQNNSFNRFCNFPAFFFKSLYSLPL